MFSEAFAGNALFIIVQRLSGRRVHKFRIRCLGWPTRARYFVHDTDESANGVIEIASRSFRRQFVARARFSFRRSNQNETTTRHRYDVYCPAETLNVFRHSNRHCEFTTVIGFRSNARAYFQGQTGYLRPANIDDLNPEPEIDMSGLPKCRANSFAAITFHVLRYERTMGLPSSFPYSE